MVMEAAAITTMSQTHQGIICSGGAGVGVGVGAGSDISFDVGVGAGAGAGSDGGGDADGVSGAAVVLGAMYFNVPICWSWGR